VVQDIPIRKALPFKVAVVAVHGVAYHAPGASAKAMSELLLSLPVGGGSKQYGPMAAQTAHIPLQPLVIDAEERLQPGDENWVRKATGFLQERTVFLTRAWKRAGKSKETSTVVADDFMRLVLQDYRGATPDNPKDQRDATTYDTMCLVGTRMPPPGPGPTGGTSVGPANRPPGGGGSTGGLSAASEPPVDVHVYEMYWADLSRPKASILAFFQALYQLLFHLASLSRLAISTGYLENKNRRVWRWLDRSQHWAIRMLTLPIPALNVLLFSALFGALPHLLSLSPVQSLWVSAIGTGALALCAYGLLSGRLHSPKRSWVWAALPYLIAILAAGLGYWAAQAGRAPRLLSLEGLLLGSVTLLLLSVGAYDEVRDGAKEVTWVLWAVWLAVFGYYWLRQPEVPVEQVSLWVVQITLAVLRLCWILVFALAIAAAILGSLAWRGVKDHGAKARAKAAVRTSRFAFAMPALGILMVTLLLWCALFLKISWQAPAKNCPAARHEPTWAEKMFGDEVPETFPTSSGPGLFFLNKQDAIQLRDRVHASEIASGRLAAADGKLSPNGYFEAALVWGSTPGFPFLLLFVTLGLLLVGFWILPSVFTERNPPRISSNQKSIRMGAWLSRGLDATAIVSWFIWAASFLVPVAFWLANRITWPASLAKEMMSLLRLTNQVTGILILRWGVLVGTVAFLTAVAKYGSSVLGIILDVDNYLRTSPKDATPRARILERYVSLLRYLDGYRNPKDGRGYDRVVIVAHSLGALISADLLRFLTVRGDPGLSRFERLGSNSGHPTEAKIDLRLFTMGNPLRQLLNRFFPYLYEWVRSEPDNGTKTLGDLTPAGAGGGASPPIPVDVEPGSKVLPVARWLNAYRSGDYVGRSIWLNEWYRRTSGALPQPVLVAHDNPSTPVREEMCIGAGAHTHYWDQSAPDIAEKLDELIAS